LQRAPGVRAWTDRGRPIPLYRMLEVEGIPPANEAKRLARFPALRLIRTGKPGSETNCHGWVFAAGQFWLKGEDGPWILEDNGYQPVERPQAQDIAVWRDPSGQVTHTAVVRSAEDGQVLLESKWGRLGSYVHMPDDQLYGSARRYYRSDRRGHQACGIGGETPPAEAAPAQQPTPGPP